MTSGKSSADLFYSRLSSKNVYRYGFSVVLYALTCLMYF